MTVHLAGSLGKKTYLLAPRGEGSLFYWHIGLKKSLWYSSVSVFHQKYVGSWKDPVIEIYQAIMNEQIYV